MLKIALSQLETIPGRPDLNSAAMLSAISEARARDAHLVIFPEMAVPGYLLGDTWEQPAFVRDCEEYGRQIIAASEGLGVIFGNVAADWEKTGEDGRVRKYNACFTAVDGRLAGKDNFPYPFRIKTLHPNYREFDDSRHFYSLRKLAVEQGRPVRDLLRPVRVEIAGRVLNIGCLVCEDAWCDDYCLDPMSILADQQCDLFVNISSSPFTLGKNNKRNRVFAGRAAQAGAPLIYVNTVGVQNNGKTVYAFDGHSTVYDAGGRATAHCPAFTPCLKIIELDLGCGGANLPAVTVPDCRDTAAIYEALNYGIANFLRQTGLQRVIIGASGGIDSAVSAALYARIVGPENILLVNMPGIYNSATTRSLAEQLAHGLGCRYTVIPIQESVDHTVRQLTQAAIHDMADGSRTHLAVSPFVVENIQARDRSARILAGLAAAWGGGFTCNANKTEITIGYSTLYGDNAGFLAALGDLWKHQVYALGEYLNNHVYGRQAIPAGIFSIVPSAELSPEHAVDEGKGDPIIYPYHDYLFRAFTERWNRAAPEDILAWYAAGELEANLGCEPGLTGRLFAGPAEFIADLEKWWNLYTGLAVAKRLQSPPIFAVSRRAFGFDHREAQNRPYFTAQYHRLKTELLKNH